MTANARRQKARALADLATRVRGLGPLHTSLALVTRATGSPRFEQAVLGRLDRDVVRSRYGVKMHSNWSDATFRMCYFGAYGTELSDLLRRRSSPFGFIDIGANQGLYSLIAGQSPHCRWGLAIEPVPSTFHLLERNVRSNSLEQLVRAVNVGVATESGSRLIRINPGHSGGASFAATNKVAGEATSIRTIDHVGLDRLIPDGPESVIVKIDVEGLEPIVVNELTQSRHVDRLSTVFYEMDEEWADPQEVEAMLRSAGFRSFRRVPGETPTHYDVVATR